MSTIYGNQKPPESRDERARSSLPGTAKNAVHANLRICLPAFYRALLSALGLRNFFLKCNLLAEIGLAESGGVHLT
jgi:hypothetical protein